MRAVDAILRGKFEPYIGVPELAAALRKVTRSKHWTVQNTRRMMVREKIARKIGGRYFVTREGVKARFPEVWDELLLSLADDDDDFSAARPAKTGAGTVAKKRKR